MGYCNLNTLYVELSHRYFQFHKNTSIATKIQKYDVIINSINNKIDRWSITISGTGDKEDTLNVFLNYIDSIFFICLGSYPRIALLKYNSKIISLSKYVHKYKSDKFFENNYFAICSIDATVINDTSAKHLDDVKLIALYSIQYLVSEKYSNLISTHRITLLLHALQGLVSNTDYQSVLNQYNSIFQNKISQKEIDKGRVPYKMAAYYVCENFFFSYERKFGSEILKVLNKTEKSFIDVLPDTRDWYSHFLDEAIFKNGVLEINKPNKLSKGDDMIIYFVIIFTAIRVMLCNRLGITVDESKLSELLYTIHDWIIDLKELDISMYKSQFYIACGESNSRFAINSDNS